MISVFLLKYEEAYKLVKINISNLIKNPENEKEEIKKILREKLEKSSKDKCLILDPKEMEDYLRNKYVEK